MHRELVDIHSLTFAGNGRWTTANTALAARCMR